METCTESLIKKINSTSEDRLQDFLDNHPLDQLHALKLHLDDLYYNTEASPISDWDYDVLKDTLSERDPSYVPPVGAKLRSHENRVELPTWMGSMDKFKPSDGKRLDRWLSANRSRSYMIASKLDGVSCLAVYGGKNKVKLYTRGDGRIGGDITYLAQFIKNLPQRLPTSSIVRGELIIPVEKFQKHAGNYVHARGMVAGLIGSKEVSHGLEDVHFVAYELIRKSPTQNTIESQYEIMRGMGFEIARHEITKTVDLEILKDFLTKFKKHELYEIDGIIVTANIEYVRNTSGNPSYAFAFKMRFEGDEAQVKVVKVEWNVSKWGKIIPRIFIEPTRLSGVLITKAAGHNAKYIYANNIGPGAIVTIVHSGSVIPYITKVVEEAPQPSMPEIPYEWDKTRVHIVVKESLSIMCEKLIEGFFSYLKILHVGESTVRKLLKNGLPNLLSILRATPEELENAGMGEKGAMRVYTNIHEGLKNVKIADVLGGAGVFGMGFRSRKVDALFDGIPNIIERYDAKEDEETLFNEIAQLHGFSEVSAQKIITGLPTASALLVELAKPGPTGRPLVTFKDEADLVQDLAGMAFVFSGIRDKSLASAVEDRGGKTSTSVSKNTSALIVKSKDGKSTSKRLKAESLGIPIYTISEFKNKFSIQ